MIHSVPNNLAFLGNLGMMEWAIILIVALLLFGRRLPEVGKSLGQGIREFKKSVKETEEDVRRESTPASRAALPNDPVASTPHETRQHEHSR